MDRKAAIAAYKERKVAAGIFAVRCRERRLCWVGRAPNLSTIWNRISFTLRHGGHPEPALQAAWNRQDGAGFEFEELERLGEDVPAISRDRILKERHAFWVEALHADRI